MSEKTRTTAAPVPFPQPRAGLFDPPELYETLRRECPIARATFPNGNEGWLVMRHEDVKTVIRDTRFSSNPSDPGYPQIHKYSTPQLADRSIISMDPPVHREQRDLISSWFTNSTAESYRQRIRASVDELIDRLLQMPQPVDLVANFTLLLPMWVVCMLFGVREDMRDLIAERTAVRIALDSTPEQIDVATRELQEAIAELVAEKRGRPADDLFSTIIEANENGDLSERDMIDMMQLLVAAGHETTSNAMSLSSVALFIHPDEREALFADRSLLRNSVEELLRWTSITQVVCPRVATEDLDVAGTTIAKGEGVRALLISANFDDEVFEDPTRFDIRRAEARRQMAFGFGPHVCIGQAYARIELQEGLWGLFTRLPNLRPAVPIEELDVKWTGAVHGLHSLPVHWDG